MRILKNLSLLALASLTLANSAFAGPPYLPNVNTSGNYWSITAFDDSATTHTQWATQNICFILLGNTGTHMHGIWYSTTFYDWNGRWRQEGDQVFMTGDYAGDIQGNAVGHDGIQWEIVTASAKNEGFGHWQEWREDTQYGLTIGFANAKLSRIGRCPFSIPTGTTIPEIEKLVVEQSLLAPRRVTADGAEALGPFDPKQLPLEKTGIFQP